MLSSRIGERCRKLKSGAEEEIHGNGEPYNWHDEPLCLCKDFEV